MKTINYDFSEFNNIYSRMISKGRADIRDTNDLRKELNKFFKDGNCKNVYYTENTDKMFFGMKVIANIDANKIYDYLTANDRVRITEYMIELDSKLLNPLMNLNSKELTAITLHEVGHLVNDSQPMEDARNYLATYLADNKETLSMSDSIHYKEILAYGLKDFLSKDRSMFYTVDEDEVLADEFVRGCGYDQYLDSAMKKIIQNNSKLYADSDISKFTTFAWTLRLYRGLRLRRVGALKTLAKAKHLTASKIEKMEMDNVARRINKIDDSMLLEDVRDKVKAKMRKMRYDSIRSLEDDYYEINMRIRNVEDEDDALYLMRQINTRLGIIEDFCNDPDVEEREKKQWFATIEKYKSLREKLSKTIVYKSKTYGIYVNYPEIKDCTYQ
jgi:hypothetical protein